MDNIALIATAEAESAVIATDSLEDRLLAAMRSTRRSWCCTREDDQFMAACEAVARSASEDERRRLNIEIEGMNKIGAMISALQAGVPVDLGAMAAKAETEEKAEPIKLRDLWDQTK